MVTCSIHENLDKNMVTCSIHENLDQNKPSSVTEGRGQEGSALSDHDAGRPGPPPGSENGEMCVP
ncbi:hypothetical protein CRUP_006256 [Coryphaenoides rupestris]|nr:hypothetical protein CRUP_006256 [Coryphaenoides rupestris]